MMKDPMDAELKELFGKLLDGELDETQQCRLTEILQTRDEARALYHKYMTVHGLLLWTLSPPNTPALDRSEQLLEQTPGVPASAGSAENSGQEAPRSPLLGFLGDTLRQGFDSLTGSTGLFVLILLLICGLGVVSLVPWSRIGGRKVPEMIDVSCARAPVARITRLADFAWSRSGAVYAEGAMLRPGQRLALKEGVVEITFSTGARVILEGGTIFEPESENSGRLHAGHLSIEVPEQAIGYTVCTPTADIVDLGTEFGVSCDAKKPTQVQVYNGAVEILPISMSIAGEPGSSLQTTKPPGTSENEISSPSDRESRRLVAGQAASIQNDGKTSSVAIRSMGARSDTSAVPGRSVPREGLRLWLRADEGTCRDVAGMTPAKLGEPVGRWIDQSGAGQSPRQMIPESRPILAQDALGNRVIRFDGTKHFEETLSEENPTLVLEADQSGEYFTMFSVFNTNTIEPLRQGIFGQFNTSNRTNRYFRIFQGGRVSYDEFGPKGGALSTPIDTVQPGKIYIATLRRDGRNRSIYVNGRLAARDDQAEVYGQTPPGRWCVGGRRHHEKYVDMFLGDMAEILIYNRVLKPERQEAVQAYLMQKYLASKAAATDGPARRN